MAARPKVPTSVGVSKPTITSEPSHWRYDVEARGPEEDSWSRVAGFAGSSLDNDPGEKEGLETLQRYRTKALTMTPDQFGGLKKGQPMPYGPGHQFRLRKYLVNKLTMTVDGFTGDKLEAGPAQTVREPESASVPPLSEAQQSKPTVRPTVLSVPKKPHGNRGNPTGKIGKTTEAVKAKKAANSGKKIPKTVAGVLGKPEPKAKPSSKKGK